MPSPIEYLISAQHDTGGWGYMTGHKPVVEPTAAVLRAIRNEPIAKDNFQTGLTWLLSCQNQDGGWGINSEDPESGWQTAWALIIMRAVNQDERVLIRAIDWLTTVGTSEVSREELQKSELPQSNNVGALAWPWLPGQVSWIEPTALAVLALNSMTNNRLAIDRIREALKYFEQYRTPSGGWNVGNAGPLDTIVIPRAYPTALVLLALTSVSPDSVKTIDLTALQQDIAKDPSVLGEAAGLLALRILGKYEDAMITHLSDRQLSDGSWEHSPFFTAWAMLALRGTW